MMYRNPLRLHLLLFAALVVATQGAMTAAAGTFSGPIAITSSANSGISSSYTYTHAVNLDGYSEPAINGVTFIMPTYWAKDPDDPIHGGDLSGANYNATGMFTGTGGWPSPDVPDGDPIAELLTTSVYSHSGYTGETTMTLTLTGLSAGTGYETVFFGIADNQFDSGERAVTMTASDTGATFSYDENAGSQNQGHRITYAYTATSSSITFSFESTSSLNFELCGFANRATSSSTTPEPGTLAILATGLIGLLAYAWRKR